MNCVERIRICERRSQGWMCPVSSGSWPSSTVRAEATAMRESADIGKAMATLYEGYRDVGLKFQFGCAASMAISA